MGDGTYFPLVTLLILRMDTRSLGVGKISWLAPSGVDPFTYKQAIAGTTEAHNS